MESELTVDAPGHLSLSISPGARARRLSNAEPPRVGASPRFVLGVAHDIRREVLGPDDRATLEATYRLGLTLVELDQLDEAVEWMTLGYEMRSRLAGADSHAR